MLRLCVLLCFAVASVLGSVGCGPAARAEPAVRCVGPPPHQPGRCDVKVAGEHFAYVVDRGGTFAVILDGEEGPRFEAVWDLEVTTTGWCLYAARRDGEDIPVICGEEAAAWPPRLFGFWWARDADRVGYVTRRGTRRHVVVNGHPSPGYDWVEPPQFSWSGHVAYVASLDRRQFVVQDGKPGRAYDLVSALTMARATGQVWYAAWHAGSVRVVVGDVEQPACEAIGRDSLAVTDDGRHWRYVGRRGGCSYMVVNGREGRAYAEVSTQYVAASTDGAHLAYAALSEGGWRIVRDGVEGPAYTTVGPPVFSPDGEHLAYAAMRPGDGLIVVDGTERAAGDAPLTDRLVLGSGGRVAYGIQRGERAVMVVDGVEGEPHDGVWKATLGAEGRSAYVTRDRGRYRVIVDSVAGRVHDGVRDPAVFNESGSHVYYIARDDGDEFVVLNGREDRHFRHVVRDSPRFTDAGTFDYLAFADDGLYRVTHTLPKPAAQSDGKPPTPAES